MRNIGVIKVTPQIKVTPAYATGKRKHFFTGTDLRDRIEPHGRSFDQAQTASYLLSPNRRCNSASTGIEPNLIRPSTSYILMRSDNLETNVDSWIASCDNERNRRRDNRPSVQQSSLVESQGALANLWYLLALLPAITVQRQAWCSPSNSLMVLLNLLDLLSTNLKQIITNLRMRISRLAINQILQECFVVAMDVTLVLHAFIFLILAVYQDSV